MKKVFKIKTKDSAQDFINIEKTIKTGSFIPRNNQSAGNSSAGNNGNAGNNTGGVPNLANAVTNKSNMPNKYMTGKQHNLSLL